MSNDSKIGIARFIAHKIDNNDVEVLEWDAFDTDFCARLGPSGGLARIIAEMSGEDEVLADSMNGLAPGFYEVLGDVHYSYHPGVSTPDYPAEPNASWWLEKVRVQPLSEDQARPFFKENRLLATPAEVTAMFADRDAETRRLRDAELAAWRKWDDHRGSCRRCLNDDHCVENYSIGSATRDARKAAEDYEKA